MRHLYITFLLAFCLRTYASDTLTRAQIYNFSVGDTFDYRNYSLSYYENEPNTYMQSTIYTRYIIFDIFWSNDSSTKTIIQKQLYPSPVTYDTLILQNINGFEVIMDTIWFTDVFPEDNYYLTDSLPEYYGQSTNFISWFTYSPGTEEVYFAKGLGKVFIYEWGGALGYNYWDSTLLVYYSGVNGTYGEPYTSFPTSIPNLTLDGQIKVYPTLNDGRFTIQTPDGIQLPVDFFVYDIQGQLVGHVILNENQQGVMIKQLPRGVYIWKAQTTENAMQVGRIVIE